MPADSPSVPVSHQVDVDAPGGLLRLDLARQLRRRRLREVDLGDQLRIVLDEGLDRALGKLQVAGDVDHVEARPARWAAVAARRRGRPVRRRQGRRCRQCRRARHGGWWRDRSWRTSSLVGVAPRRHEEMRPTRPIGYAHGIISTTEGSVVAFPVRPSLPPRGARGVVDRAGRRDASGRDGDPSARHVRRRCARFCSSDPVAHRHAGAGERHGAAGAPGGVPAGRFRPELGQRSRRSPPSAWRARGSVGTRRGPCWTGWTAGRRLRACRSVFASSSAPPLVRSAWPADVIAARRWCRGMPAGSRAAAGAPDVTRNRRDRATRSRRSRRFVMQRRHRRPGLHPTGHTCQVAGPSLQLSMPCNAAGFLVRGRPAPGRVRRAAGHGEF